YLLQVRGLATETGAIVDHLEVDLTCREIDCAHELFLSPKKPSSRASVSLDQSSPKLKAGALSLLVSSTILISSAVLRVKSLTLPSAARLSKMLTSKAFSPSSSM